ncbi:MAG: NADP-dependent malic enzyme [Anaerofustis sp.]
MDYYKEALRLHEEKKGKIEVTSKVAVDNLNDLSVAYTPGVAQPCIEISKHPEDVYKYTAKGNMVAIITDGSAVLGLGNIGAVAAIPVMEGKAVLFKEFGNVDAFPICIETQDAEEIIRIAKNIAPVFGGINLEDIAAPHCFEIERRLQEALDIPVFHDDQHGTAVVASAALINALKLAKKTIGDMTIVLSGAGSAGTAIVKMLMALGADGGRILVCNSKGIIHKGMDGLKGANQTELAEMTNRGQKSGTIADALNGADVFIGVSVPNLVTADMVRTMNEGAIVLPMANPTPEIMPEDAKRGGAFIIGTGRSDFPNQINNVLAFPGIFRGALDARATRITQEMKVAAVHALASLITEEELHPDYIIPKPFDKRVADHVAKAVCAAWKNRKM